MPRYTFQRFAGSRQVRIRTFEDLVALRDLPVAHWLATACPTEGLKCDPRFLRFLDSDRNGRIRARELLQAIAWLASMLAEPTNAVPGSDTLELAHLGPMAEKLRATAELVLDNLGIPDHRAITIEQVRRTTQVFKKVTANGDGIISPDGIDDDASRQAAIDILAHFRGAMDKSGERGLDLATIADFERARKCALDWVARGHSLQSWGEESRRLALLVREARPRLDEYFLECRIVASQPEAAERLRFRPEDVSASIGNREALAKVLSALPIAQPDPLGRLNFDTLVRGGAFELLVSLRNEVLRPLLGAKGSTVLAEEDWERVKREAQPILAWHDEESSHPLLALGPDRLRAISDEEIAHIRMLCNEDLRLGETLANLDELEKLILYQRWLFTFANNFVSMPDLYNQNQRALYEQGTLVLSGREFSLAILVPDRARHAVLAADAGMYIMYLEVYGGKPESKLEIAVPVTSGTSDNLWLGKRGIFHSVDGEDYDATIVQVIDQPISLFEALTRPFTRLGTFVSKRLERVSQRLETEPERTLETPTPLPGSPAAGLPVPAPAPMQHVPAPAAAGPGLGNVLMSGSVAFAAVGSALAFIVGQIEKTIREGLFGFVIALFILIALIALPIGLFAWIRIRRQNLATVLEAAGWALNDRLRMTRRLGRLFTRRPKPPVGSRMELRDKVRRNQAPGEGTV